MSEPIDIKSIRKLIETEFPDRFGRIAGYKKDLDNTLKVLSRSLPPEAYEDIREQILAVIARGGSNDGGLKVVVVVDANIIIGEAFRAAKGKHSSTERILTSPFIEVAAPIRIHEEVESRIVRDLHKGMNLEVALGHAKRLLSHVKIVSNIDPTSLLEATGSIGKFDPNDIHYLAVAIGINAEAIVTRDSGSFPRQQLTKVWSLKETVDTVVSYESNSLLLFSVGVGGSAVLEGIVRVLSFMLKTLFEAVTLILNLLPGLVSGSVELLQMIPDWAWIFLAGIVGGMVLLAIFSKDFRDSVLNEFNNAIDFAKKALERICDELTTILTAISEFMLLTWNDIEPLSGPLFDMSLALCFATEDALYSLLSDLGKV